MQLFRTPALAAAALLLAGSATAAPIKVFAGSDVTVHFNGFGDDPLQFVNGLTATLQLNGFSFQYFDAGPHAGQTAITFQYSLQNTSSSPVTSSRVSAFGFNSTPNRVNTVDNLVTGAYSAILYNVNFPNQVGNVELCFTVQNCPGAGGGGVAIGETGTGSATVYFIGNLAAPNAGLTIDSWFVRYQSITGAGNITSGTGKGTPQTGGEVPEPATVILTGAGLALAGLASRLRRPKHTN